MDKFSFFLFFSLLSFSSNLVFSVQFVSSSSVSSSSECSNEKLVLYQINITTHWSRQNFPKQYPEFRPPAQFSKLVGRSHSEDFNIFQLGEMATEGMKKFAETGTSDLLDEYSQGASGVLDAFNAPAIGQGVGETETQFFLDSNHTRVSIAMRIIPSPDWFFGISNLDLCAGKEWIDSFAINVTHLFDAGTDSGYTFTAPNFATVPAQPITRISSQLPNHKASSFYYPDKPSLPPIATITFSKLREYSPWKAVAETAFPAGPSLTEEIDVNDIGSEINDSNQIAADAPALKSIGKKRRLRRLKGSRVRDCRVSEWSDWSECSALCGVGVQHRTRSVIHHPRGGGADCPPFTDKRLCSSSRDCRQNYFDWEDARK